VACGEPMPCACRRSDSAIVVEARRLGAIGVRQAKARQYVVAFQTLKKSADLGSESPVVWQALGLCALACGSTHVANEAWEQAVRLGADDSTSAWRTSLRDGEIRKALGAYNDALEEARRGADANALAMIRDVENILPSFLPGVQLEGVILLRQQAARDRLAAWEARSRFWRDDPLVTRLTSEIHFRERASETRAVSRAQKPRMIRSAVLFGSAGLIAGFLVGRLIVGPPDVAVSAVEPVVTSASTHSAAANASLIDAALRRDQSRLLEEIDSIGLSAPGWSDEGKRIAGELLAAKILREYARARQSLRAQDTASAWSHLTIVLRSKAESYVLDDALYDAMRISLNRADTAKAKQFAATLLARYPQSIFANSITRAIARLPHRRAE
jgi:tetratricopeptide (TPR) repeat protein